MKQDKKLWQDYFLLQQKKIKQQRKMINADDLIFSSAISNLFDAMQKLYDRASNERQKEMITNLLHDILTVNGYLNLQRERYFLLSNEMDEKTKENIRLRKEIEKLKHKIIDLETNLKMYENE